VGRAKDLIVKPISAKDANKIVRALHYSGKVVNYFLDPTARERLTVPILPFSEIDRRGAGMYRGKPRVRSADSGTPGIQPGGGGANPTRTLSPGAN